MTNKNVNVDRIMKRFGLNERTVIKDLDIITKGVLEVKPSFKEYYKTPCYLPDIRKRTVIKPLDS